MNFVIKQIPAVFTAILSALMSYYDVRFAGWTLTVAFLMSAFGFVSNLIHGE